MPLPPGGPLPAPGGRTLTPRATGGRGACLPRPSRAGGGQAAPHSTQCAARGRCDEAIYYHPAAAPAPLQPAPRPSPRRPQDEEVCYLVQELCSGGTVAELLESTEGGALSEREAALLIRGMLQFLEDAHALNVCYGGERPPPHPPPTTTSGARMPGRLAASRAGCPTNGAAGQRQRGSRRSAPAARARGASAVQRTDTPHAGPAASTPPPPVLGPQCGPLSRRDPP